jgi:hypothetical protein
VYYTPPNDDSQPGPWHVDTLDNCGYTLLVNLWEQPPTEFGPCFPLGQHLLADPSADPSAEYCGKDEGTDTPDSLFELFNRQKDIADETWLQAQMDSDPVLAVYIFILLRTFTSPVLVCIQMQLHFNTIRLPEVP